uniref:Putative secreted peptide n=1 Tax=Anopheles braziliensis TaxID=58242 RepID=A0A2M3ZSZ8_9DIPT
MQLVVSVPIIWIVLDVPALLPRTAIYVFERNLLIQIQHLNIGLGNNIRTQCTRPCTATVRIDDRLLYHLTIAQHRPDLAFGVRFIASVYRSANGINLFSYVTKLLAMFA